MGFIFDKVAPSPLKIYVSKDALNIFLVRSSTKNSLRSAKNVVFLLFCILVDWPILVAPLPPGYTTDFYFQAD